MDNLKAFLKRYKIRVTNFDYYLEALTHPSFNNESDYNKNYQRLEFLGDAILDKQVTIFIYNNFKTLDEGKMSLLRSKFVKKDSLSSLTKEIGLNILIRKGKSIRKVSDNLLEDVFEALIGAMYKDRGSAEVRSFLEKVLFPKIKESSTKNNKDPKTKLQEYLQSESRETIIYEISKIKNGFNAKVYHDNLLFGHGVGKTKKKAEAAAAKNALKRLGNK